MLKKNIYTIEKKLYSLSILIEIIIKCNNY